MAKETPAEPEVLPREIVALTDLRPHPRNYAMFAAPGGSSPPFRLNAHIYSATLINNEMPYYTWRLLYNDDTDLCLQVLAGGLCTVQINAFVVHKVATMTIKGGNTDDLYRGDGRLKMARALERMWPGVVETDRRFNRPQHVVAKAWRNFDTQLIRREDVDFDALDGARYEMDLVRVREQRAYSGRKQPDPLD